MLKRFPGPLLTKVCSDIPSDHVRTERERRVTYLDDLRNENVPIIVEVIDKCLEDSPLKGSYTISSHSVIICGATMYAYTLTYLQYHMLHQGFHIYRPRGAYCMLMMAMW